MKQRDWERDLELRQRNIVFPDTVQNAGRFYRNILRPGMPLSGPQRIGLILVAVFCLVSSTVIFAGALTEALSGGNYLIVSLPMAAVAVLPFALSLKLFKRILFGSSVKQRNTGARS